MRYPASELDVDGVTCIGDGALRYRPTLEERGAVVPPDESPLHVPHARLHAAIAGGLRLRRRRLARVRARAGREGAGVIEIRPLRTADLDAVGEIERLSMPAPWSPAMFAGEIAKPTSVCLGAWEAGERSLVGYVIVSRYVDAWHVMNLVVAESHRRRGIAKALLDDVFGRTDGAGRRGFTLEVRASNEAALKLYEAMGFRRQGVRRGYYTDNREDAVIMWRDASGVDAA